MRAIRRTPGPASRSPHVRRVDACARRTRHPYATLLRDLDRRRPVALLPAREATTVAPWLQSPPGGEVVVRERAEASAEAARLGAPAAGPVADRLPLRQPLADVRTAVFSVHAPQLARVPTQPLTAPPLVHDPADPATGPRRATVPLAPPQPSTRAAARAAARRAPRVALDEPGWMSPRQGWTLDAMAAPVGRSRRPVPRSLQRPTFPARQPR